MPQAQIRARVRRAATVLAALASLALSGCDMVVLDGPIGDAPATLDEQAIDGVWYRVEEGAVPFHVRVLDKGNVLIATAGASEEGFVLEQFPLDLMTADGELYVSGPADEITGGGYYFGRVVERSKDQWIIAIPDVDAFERAVRAGTLAGEVEPSDHLKVVRVRASDALAFIRASSDAPPWSEDRVVVLRRFDPARGEE